MSALQDLLVTMDGITRDADRHAGELAAQAQRLARAAAGAASIVHSSSRNDGLQVAQLLASAQRAVADAGRLLQQAARRGRGFIAHHSSRGSGGPESPTASPEFAPQANLEPFVAPGHAPRYLRPTAAQQSSMSDAVSFFGARDIAGWVGAVNPNYDTAHPAWTNNCGPCARSVADAYQGVAVAPALGDGGVPPGELAEMWDATGVRPSAALTNHGRQSDPASFTSAAYASLSAKLAEEGPGAVAIIGVDWDDPRAPQGSAGGHWFNAYVDDQGVVQWADGQVGVAGGWPPGYATPVWNVEAVVRTEGGLPWKEVVL